MKVDELEGYASRLANFTLHLRGRRGGVEPPEQGVRHPPHASPSTSTTGWWTSTSAARRRWSTRCASTWPTRASQPASFYYEKFAGSGVVTEIGEIHVKVPESDEAFDARMALELGAASMVCGRLSADQLAEYRRLAEATATAHLGRPVHRRGRLPRGQRGVPPVPGGGHRQPDADRGAPAAAGQRVHGRRCCRRRWSWSATSPRTTSTSSTRSRRATWTGCAR